MENWIKESDITDFVAENFCLTGKMQRGRKVLHRMIERRDGSYEERVNKWVTVLVVGEDAGNKLDDAQRRNLRLLPDTEFIKLLARVPEVEGIESLSPDPSPKREGSMPTAPAAAPTAAPTPPPAPSASDGCPVGTQQSLFPEEESPAPAPTEEVATPHPHWAGHVTPVITPRKKWRFWKIAGHVLLYVLIILSRASLVLAGISLAIVLWLAGIPASNPLKQ